MGETVSGSVGGEPDRIDGETGVAAGIGGGNGGAPGGKPKRRYSRSGKRYAGKEGSGQPEFANPGDSIGTDEGSSEVERLRVRRGTANKTSGKKAAQKTLAVNDVAVTIGFVYVAIAYLTGFEGWKLSEDEAKMLANSLMPVLEIHSIEVSPVVAAHINLGMALFTINASRMIDYRLYRMRKAAAAEQEAQQATAPQMGHNGGPPLDPVAAAYGMGPNGTFTVQ